MAWKLAAGNAASMIVSTVPKVSSGLPSLRLLERRVEERLVEADVTGDLVHHPFDGIVFGAVDRLVAPGRRGSSAGGRSRASG